MVLHTLPGDGLGRIRVEIEDFVSRENRRHGDPWLQQVGWVEADRTLTLFVRRPPSGTVQTISVHYTTVEYSTVR